MKKFVFHNPEYRATLIIEDETDEDALRHLDDMCGDLQNWTYNGKQVAEAIEGD